MGTLRNPVCIAAALLLVGSAVCLGVGLRLLALHGEALLPLADERRGSAIMLLGLVGGALVLWWCSIALLAARRFTQAQQESEPEIASLDIRLEVTPGYDGPITVENLELVLPPSWTPDNRYLLGDAAYHHELRRLQERAVAVDSSSSALIDCIEHPLGPTKRPKPRWSKALCWVRGCRARVRRSTP